MRIIGSIIAAIFLLGLGVVFGHTVATKRPAKTVEAASASSAQPGFACYASSVEWSQNDGGSLEINGKCLKGYQLSYNTTPVAFQGKPGALHQAVCCPPPQNEVKDAAPKVTPNR